MIMYANETTQQQTAYSFGSYYVHQTGHKLKICQSQFLYWWE